MVSYMDGFESICSQVGPMEIVSLVNDMFTIFDKLTEKHDVYKVVGRLKRGNIRFYFQTFKT